VLASASELARAAFGSEADHTWLLDGVLLHQAAGSAVVDLVVRTDPSLSRAEAVRTVEAANPDWFSRTLFERATNRRRVEHREPRIRLGKPQTDFGG